MSGIQYLPEENVKASARILQEVSCDPCFAAPAMGGLDYPEAKRDAALLTHISHAVTNQSDNLHLHLRRIRLAAALALPEAFAEATADLFIVLGSKGSDLKNHVLKIRENLLSEQQLAMLHGMSTESIDAYTPLPVRARLSKGNTGRLCGIVVPLDSAERTSDDAENRAHVFLETVHDLLNSGHLVEACEMLENELPEAEEALWREGAAELASLYRYLDDGEVRARNWWATLWRSNQERARAWAKLVTQMAEP